MSARVPLTEGLLRPAFVDDADRLCDATWLDIVATANEGDDDSSDKGCDRILPGPYPAPLPDDGVLVGLIERIDQRDARALAALYDLAAARVYSFVHRFTRRHALTEEVVEDTFWQVWRQAPRFDLRRGRAMSWLLAMARSRAIDALRREQRFQREPLVSDGSEAFADEGALDLLEAARGASDLRSALAELEPRNRQLLALAFFRGLTHEEIAAQAAMPLGSVKSAIRRALRQLRGHLEASPTDEPMPTRSVP
jgi:RNA polymerase sigma factor (sigma-70 family)